jgi:hypothetical protein
VHEELNAWRGTHGISETGRDPKLGSLRNVETCVLCNVFNFKRNLVLKLCIT